MKLIISVPSLSRGAHTRVRCRERTPFHYVILRKKPETDSDRSRWLIFLKVKTTFPGWGKIKKYYRERRSCCEIEEKRIVQQRRSLVDRENRSGCVIGTFSRRARSTSSISSMYLSIARSSSMKLRWTERHWTRWHEDPLSTVLDLYRSFICRGRAPRSRLPVRSLNYSASPAGRICDRHGVTKGHSADQISIDKTKHK